MISVTASMGLSTHILIVGLLHLSLTASKNCSDFRVFDGDDQLSDYECIQFGTDSCKHGQSNFPANLSVGESVSSPPNFEAVMWQNETTVNNIKYVSSGVTYKWNVPDNGISRHYMKGYYLNMQKVGSANVICRLWDLQSMDLSGPNIRFEFDLFPLNGPDTYVVELFSLPPPSDEEYADGLFDRHILTTQAPQDLYHHPEVYPFAWKTWISLNLEVHKAKIEVKFGLHQEYFTKYLVQLLRAEDLKLLSEFYFSSTKNSVLGEHTFTNVSSGNYTVQVSPFDQHFFDSKLCQCWKKDEVRQRVCETCQITTTKAFTFKRVLNLNTVTSDPQASSSDLHITRNHLSTTQAVIVGASSMRGNTGSTDRPNAGLIAGVVIPSFLVLVLLLFGVYYFYRKHSWNVEYDTGKQLDHKSNMVAHAIHENSSMEVESEKGLKVPHVNRKTVLLLASEDHRYFQQILQNFAHFLELHCQCDVLFTACHLHNTANSYSWLSRMIDSADFVIIINSEAAYHLYQAYQNGWAYKEADLGPEGELFTPGIRHICGKISKGLDVSNVLMAHFEHTDPKHCLPLTALPISIYNLPHRLKTFLFRVHDLNEYNMNLWKVNLPLHGNVQELEGGNEWLCAVRDSKKFESMNKGWFQEKFGRPVYTGSQQYKPDLRWQVSMQSDESGFYEAGLSQRRLSSVSSHAEDAVDYDSAKGTDNPVFIISREDFISPSECEVVSANSVLFSHYADGEKQWVMDQGSAFSNQASNVQIYQFHQRTEDCYSLSTSSGQSV